MIERLSAQRSCLDLAAKLVTGREGIVLELGLGKGRTYTHLALALPGREIHAFDKKLHAPPEATPPLELVHLGKLKESLPEAATALGRSAILAHMDLGYHEDTAEDRLSNMAAAKATAELLLPLLLPGAILVCDKPIPTGESGLGGYTELPPPENVACVPDARGERAFPYHIYRFESD